MTIVKNEVVLECEIEKVWDIVTSLENQAWRTSIDHIEIIDAHHFIEVDKEGYKTEFIILNKVKNKLYEFNLKNENIEGHWIGKFKSIDDQLTSIEIVESIEVKKKMMSLFAKKYLEKQQKQYINDLKNALIHQ